MLVAVCGLIGTANAQFSAGTISVGGGVSFTSENSEKSFRSLTMREDPFTTFKLTPSVGYFFADDLEAGMQIGYTSMSIHGDNRRYSSTMFAVGPYVRKYFSFGQTAAFFGQASVGVGGGQIRYESSTTTRVSDKASVFSVGVTPGFVFRPAERLGIELSAGFLGYNSTKTQDYEGDEGVTVKDSDFGLSLDLSNVSLGVKLYF